MSRGLWAMSGSSPLTRGKRYRRPPRAARIRLIPAHAGKTVASQKAIMRGTAHPRSRGENSYAWMPSSSMYGSSPLTRGKLGLGGSSDHPAGLIPAHAGKTAPPITLVTGARAHPRSRGENSPPCLTISSGLGSSPLTRGKPVPPISVMMTSGLIPAHAGKTRRSTSS